MNNSTGANVQSLPEQKKLLEFTISEMALFELNMRINGLSCMHFSPASVRFESENVKIDIDHEGLTVWIQPFKDTERTILDKWQQVRNCEPIDSILDALELLDIDRVLGTVVYEMEAA